MSPLVQGLIPPKSATCLLYFPSTLLSATQHDASSRDRKKNDAIGAAVVRKLMPEVRFSVSFL